MTYQTNAFAHGIGNSAVSAQWYSRPADQKFLSLDAMLQFKRDDAARMNSRIVNTHKIKVVGDLDETNPSTGQIFVEYTDENRQENASTPTNWSFGQLSQLCGAPAGYLRDLPAPLAADCIQWGLRYNRGKELVKVYDTAMVGDTAGEIRAATGPDYGRIFDWEIIKPIKDLVDASGGRWKVPGMMVGQRDGLAVYDPEIPVSMDTTTLFASDRDVFVFLVDDRNPIEIGKLANGEPDFVAKDDDDRFDFLVKRAGLSQRMAKAAAARHLEEEGRPVESVWDAAQAITAIARDVPHQDQRIEVEKKAGVLLDKVAA
jgi:hypothetical protein